MGSTKHVIYMAPEIKDKDAVRDELAKKIAKQIITTVAANLDKIEILEQDQTKLAEMYKPIFESFLNMMIENDVPISNLQYIFGLVQIVFQKSAHYLQLWNTTNQDIAEAITFNRESNYDVTVKDLAQFLDANKEGWLKRIQDSKKAMEDDKKNDGSIPSPFVGKPE